MANAKKKPTKKTVKPGKDIIASMAEDFKEKLLKLVEQGIKNLTIDFKGVNMVDSVGIGILIATHNSLDNVGGKLTIKNVSDDICNLFMTMRLDQHFEVEKAG
jgi:anti-anti-sigma factor